MISVKSSDVIDRPVGDVFAYAADQSNEPEWHTDVLEIKPTPGSPDSGVGSKWIVTIRFMGRNEYEVEVTAFEVNRRVEITTRTGPLRPTTNYLFEPEGDGTRFTRTVDIPTHGFMRLMAPFMGANARRRNQRFVQNLKRRMEETDS